MSGRCQGDVREMSGTELAEVKAGLEVARGRGRGLESRGDATWHLQVVEELEVERQQQQEQLEQKA